MTTKGTEPQDDWLKVKYHETFPPELKRNKDPQLVQVDWVDSTSFRGWAKETEWTDRGPNKCRSVGYLMSQDKDSLHIAASKDENNSFNDRQSIPRGCVVAVRKMKVENG